MKQLVSDMGLLSSMLRSTVQEHPVDLVEIEQSSITYSSNPNQQAYASAVITLTWCSLTPHSWSLDVRTPQTLATWQHPHP